MRRKTTVPSAYECKRMNVLRPKRPRKVLPRQYCVTIPSLSGISSLDSATLLQHAFPTKDGQNLPQGRNQSSIGHEAARDLHIYRPHRKAGRKQITRHMWYPLQHSRRKLNKQVLAPKEWDNKAWRAEPLLTRPGDCTFSVVEQFLSLGDTGMYWVRRLHSSSRQNK